MTARLEAPSPVVSGDAPDPAPAARPGLRGRTVLGYALAVLAVVAATVGIRYALRPHAHTVQPVAVAHPAAKVPSNPQVEAVWGLRFTDVILLADNGGIELRYQVFDHGKAERIHLGDPTSNQLPTLRVEGTRAQVTPSTVMMHFHHGDVVNGESYSIVYGNPGGVVRAGDYVTIVMKDGLEIRHVQVST